MPDNWTSFQAQLKAAVTGIAADKLVVGLQTVRASDGKPYPIADVVERFQLLESYGIRRLAMWDSPIPDAWLPLLAQWVDQ